MEFNYSGDGNIICLVSINKNSETIFFRHGSKIKIRHNQMLKKSVQKEIRLTAEARLGINSFLKSASLK
jgi:hypothetical protein